MHALKVLPQRLLPLPLALPRIYQKAARPAVQHNAGAKQLSTEAAAARGTERRLGSASCRYLVRDINRTRGGAWAGEKGGGAGG